MKAKVTLILTSALLFGACTTGTYVTDRYDDIYFSPGDVPPPAIVEEPATRTGRSNVVSQQQVITELEENDDGSRGLKNHIFESDGHDADAYVYDMDNMQLMESDTSVYENEGDIDYVINNYYDADDLDFTYRINRFHRPFFYGSYYPFYDPWYYDPWDPYYSWGYSGYYSPWGYNSWYSPYYSIGFSWHSPWYYSSWGYPYYGNGYWGHNHGYYYDSDRYDHGHRRSSYSNVARSGSVSGNRISSSGSSRLKNASSTQNMGSSRRGASSVVSNSGRRTGTVSNGNTTKSTTIMDTRRSGSSSVVSSSGRRAVSEGNTGSGNNVQGTQRTYQPRTSTQSRTYTPSYSKPRTVTRSSYNSSNYATPRTSTYRKPATSSSAKTYSAPNSSSESNRRTYRSSSSYSKGSSRSSAATYQSAPVRSSSSGNTYRSSGSSSVSSGSGSSGVSRSSSSGSSGGSSRSTSSGSGRR